jgi:hypothetical protein
MIFYILIFLYFLKLYREARRMALKKIYPDLEVKTSELLAKMLRPFSASSTPVHSDLETDSDTEEQTEHEVLLHFLIYFLFLN